MIKEKKRLLVQHKKTGTIMDVSDEESTFIASVKILAYIMSIISQIFYIGFIIFL